MTNLDIIKANDKLRTRFVGGRIEFCHGPYDIDDRTMGRMLSALTKYSKFAPDSLHNEGCFLFSGFACAWKIEDVDGERVLRVWVNGDTLNGC